MKVNRVIYEPRNKTPKNPYNILPDISVVILITR